MQKQNYPRNPIKVCSINFLNGLYLLKQWGNTHERNAGLANQTEGGMLQAASWTLMEEVKFDEQHVSSLDWGSYPIFRFSDIPQIEIAVINRPDMPSLGGGEASQAPASAAIANAVYKACGKRVRDLPIRAEKITG